MSLVLAQSDDFWADMLRQVDWYRDNASPEIAERYVDAVEFTLGALIKNPGMGRLRFADWPELAGMRSWKVQRPYQRHLIFYRFDNKKCLLNESCTVRATCLAFSYANRLMSKHGDTVMRFLRKISS